MAHQKAEPRNKASLRKGERLRQHEAPKRQATADGTAARPFHLREIVRRVCTFFETPCRPTLLGLAFAHCWLFSIQRTASLGAEPLLRPMFFWGMLATFLLCGVASLVTRRNVSIAPGMVVGYALVGTLTTFVLVFDALGIRGTAPELALAFACGFCIGGCYLIWGSLYARLNIRQTMFILFCSVALGSALKIPFSFFAHGWAAVPFCLLPILCVACWAVERNKPLGEPKPSRIQRQESLTKADAPYLAHYLLAVAMFGIAIGVERLVNSEFFTMSVAGIVGCHLVEIVVAISLMATVYRQHATLTFPNLWMLILVVYATGLVIVEYGGGEAAGGLATGLVTAAQMLVVAFWWFALSDISQRTTLPSDIVFGLGYPVYMLPMAAISSGFVEPMGHLRSMPLLAVYALLVSVYLCMRAHPRKGHELLTGLTLTATSRGDALVHQMDLLERNFSLSPREREIAKLYAQGRSRSYISDKLVLSETTVRDHISHVYRKLGVHNKQDFLNKLESAGT